MADLDQDEQKQYVDVLKKLEEHAQLTDVQLHEGWKIFQKGWKVISEISKRKLATIDPARVNDIIKLQVNVHFYENVIPETIRIAKDLAKERYEFADENGWLQEIGSFLTQRQF